MKPIRMTPPCRAPTIAAQCYSFGRHDKPRARTRDAMIAARGRRAPGFAMELPTGLRISIEETPRVADRDAIGYALDAYNREFLGETGFTEFALFVRDEQDAIRAGLVGSTYAGWLFVADLWVHAALRRRGIGRELLARAERRAAELGCHSVRLDTFSFQAPAFYRRLGYEVFGALDHPPHHRRLFLSKPLEAGRAPKRMRLFPASIKGVLFDGDRVVMLENERLEWELPGGRLDPGEDPAACLRRECNEELGVDVAVDAILDCWVYPVDALGDVLIVTYGLRRLDERALRLSHEHRRLGRFGLAELEGLPMPEGYRRSIGDWAARCGVPRPVR
jgi:8-oxo-dGTP pyrophosphatase MutT (NUDIX family)/GNAT superfamily N-acetyltransferase